MTLLLESSPRANAPLTGPERAALAQNHIGLRHELAEAEQAGIAAATRWAFARPRDILDEPALRGLHRRIYGGIWQSAGRYRTECARGDAWRIPAAVGAVLTDTRVAVDRALYPADEIALRFHHRLMALRAFDHGHGCHARLATDILAVSLGRPRFSWGWSGSGEPVAPATRYEAALRAAAGHNIAPLIHFARN